VTLNLLGIRIEPDAAGRNNHILELNFSLVKAVGFQRGFQSKEQRLVPITMQTLGHVSREALIRVLHKAASCFGSLSPAIIASMMCNPVSPAISLMTLLSWIFISKSAFCMW
jgi:hypothetical protein